VADAVANGNGKVPRLLTATGSLRQEADGYLTAEGGMVLMGWAVNANGTIPSCTRDTSDSLEPIQIRTNDFSSDPTTAVNLGVNLPATETEAGSNGDSEVLSIEYFDNLGTSEKLEVVFTPTVPATGMSNEWTLSIQDSASGGAVVGEYTLTFDDTRGGGGKLASVAAVSGGGYDAATGTVVVTVDGGPIEINIGTIGGTMGITQLSDTFAPVDISKDGTPIGSMIGVEVDQNGLVRASFDTGVTKVIYKVQLVDMPNPNGMVAMDKQTYMPSPDSGASILWAASAGPTAGIVSFAR